MSQQPLETMQMLGFHNTSVFCSAPPLNPASQRQGLNFMPLNERQSIIDQGDILLIATIICTKTKWWLMDLDFRRICARVCYQNTIITFEDICIRITSS